MKRRNPNKPLPLEAFKEDDTFPLARTEKGLKFDRYYANLQRVVNDPSHSKDLEEAGLAVKNLTPGNTTTTQVLQNLSVMYANDEFIGNRLMPEVPIPVSKGLSFAYWLYEKRLKFQRPVTTIGTDGAVNQVSENVSQTTGSLSKRALQEYIDAWDQEMWDTLVADLIDPTMNVLDLLALDREIAQATLLCTSGNYAATGSPTVTWNSATGGDPGKDVDAIKSSIWRGTQQTSLVAFTSWDVHRVLKRHPVILDTFKYGGNSPMQATREMLAEYFEVDDYLVGLPSYDSANDGQSAASYAKIWSDVFGVVRVATRPSRRSAHFASTFVQAPTQQTWFDPKAGGKGGFFTKVADAHLEKVICSDCGYLLTSVLT
jgi:hypothetical protein